MYNFPTTAPCVQKDSLIRVTRRLPSDGEILVEIGQRVAADEVVAVGRGSTAPHSIDAAGELGVAPADVVKGVTRELGATVKAGEVLISVRAGLRRKDLKAPEDGTLLAVDGVAGRVRFQPAGARVELKAHVAGTVEAIDGRRAVTIGTTATQVQGIWGLGGETVGVLRVLSADRDGDLRPEMLDGRLALAVVMAGRSASADTLKKAAAVGVKAVILGGLEEAEFRAFAEMQGKVGPRWYVGGPDWELPSPTTTLPFTLILTEGFGRVAMTWEAFSALRECEGREVSLAGTTRLRARLTRPTIIVPMTGRGDPRGANAAVIQVGTRVRLVDPHHLGQAGVVLHPPALRPAGDGMLRDIVDIELDGGGLHSFPLANLEVLS